MIGLLLARIGLVGFYIGQAASAVVVGILHCIFHPLGLLTDKWIKKR